MRRKSNELATPAVVPVKPAGGTCDRCHQEYAEPTPGYDGLCWACARLKAARAAAKAATKLASHTVVFNVPATRPGKCIHCGKETAVDGFGLCAKCG